MSLAGGKKLKKFYSIVAVVHGSIIMIHFDFCVTVKICSIRKQSSRKLSLTKNLPRQAESSGLFFRNKRFTRMNKYSSVWDPFFSWIRFFFHTNPPTNRLSDLDLQTEHLSSINYSEGSLKFDRTVLTCGSIYFILFFFIRKQQFLFRFGYWCGYRKW